MKETTLKIDIILPWLFLMVPWVGLQYVIVVFPDHTHFLFCINIENCKFIVATVALCSLKATGIVIVVLSLNKISWYF